MGPCVSAGAGGRGGCPAVRARSGPAGGRSELPRAVRAGPGRSGLAAPREALRRVQLHRLPPPHLALLPVGVGLQPLQHGQALRQALGGREQDVVVEEGAQDGSDQGSDPEDLRGAGGRLAGRAGPGWRGPGWLGRGGDYGAGGQRLPRTLLSLGICSSPHLAWEKGPHTRSRLPNSII